MMHSLHFYLESKHIFASNFLFNNQPIFNQYYTPTNLRKSEVFYVFRGYIREALVENGLNQRANSKMRSSTVIFSIQYAKEGSIEKLIDKISKWYLEKEGQYNPIFIKPKNKAAIAIKLLLQRAHISIKLLLQRT